MKRDDEKISDKKADKIAKVYHRDRIPKGVLIDKNGKPTRPDGGGKK